MAEGFETRFYAAINDWLNNDPYTGPVHSARVTYVDQDTITGGYCESCWYEEIVLKIGYIDADTEKPETYTYRGGMAELISELA